MTPAVRTQAQPQSETPATQHAQERSRYSHEQRSCSGAVRPLGAAYACHQTGAGSITPEKELWKSYSVRKHGSRIIMPDMGADF
jgi:hypothetical protein